ncbi:copper resistance protein NlpE [Flavilitoribacter nigricans]|nr:copper resistance protein NlpE [Flavilitoribacter nigricans]
MKRCAFTLFLLIIVAGKLSAQQFNPEFAGHYTDYNGMPLTSLELKTDGTFSLSTVDPVFFYQYGKYVTQGNWVSNGDEVILNPELRERKIETTFESAELKDQDSITLRIDYLLQTYEAEVLQSSESFEFDQLTVYINKKRNYHHLVRHEKRRNCAFAPRIKNQVVVKENNEVRIPAQEVTQIGFMTYGFEDIKWFPVEPEGANYFSLSIVHPVDTERMPRSREVIIKGRRAYFYQHRGKVNTSWLAAPLIKKKKVADGT